MEQQTASTKKRYWIFSGIEFTYCLSIGATGYLTVFLQNRGMSGFDVGLINAINLSAAILAGPIMGSLCDRIRSIRKVLILCLVAGGLLYALIPSTYSASIGPVSLAMFLIPLGTFFRSPGNSLSESWVVRDCARYGMRYGTVRLWGSASYAIISLLLGVIIPLTGVEFTFYLYALTLIPVAVLVLMIPGDGTREKKAPAQLHFSELFRNFYLMAFLVFIVIVNTPTNLAYSFVPYMVEEVGGDTGRLGLIYGLESMLEIPVLLLMNRFRKRFPLPAIAACAAVMYILETFLYSVSVNMAMLVAVSVFHGIGAGIVIGSASNYIYALAPSDLKVTAQAVYASVNSLAAIGFSLVGGWIIDSIGVRAFYSLTAGFILLALVLFGLSFLFGVRVLKKPLPDGVRPGVGLAEQQKD